MKMFNVISLSKHPHLCCFLKGVAWMDPPQVCRNWKLHTVLLSLTRPLWANQRGFPEVFEDEKTSLQPSLPQEEYQSWEHFPSSLSSASSTKDKMVLKTDPVFWPKVSSAFHRSQEISLPSFCPNPRHSREKIWQYARYHEGFEDIHMENRAHQENRCPVNLFSVSLPNTGNKISKWAISRSLKACIIEAYKLHQLDVQPRITAH